MIKNALLRVQILNYDGRAQRYNVRGQLFDGSQFDINVPFNTVSNFPGENREQRAWLRVEHHGEQNDKDGNSSGVCSVVLPQPHIQYGARVNVATKHVELDVTKVDDSVTRPPLAYDARTFDVKNPVKSDHVVPEKKSGKCCGGTCEETTDGGTS
tara:strand:+ start:137 stop:601 length:465 start_codon:yes stop_codon:yes gene_type:complete